MSDISVINTFHYETSLNHHFSSTYNAKVRDSRIGNANNNTYNPNNSHDVRNSSFQSNHELDRTEVRKP